MRATVTAFAVACLLVAGCGDDDDTGGGIFPGQSDAPTETHDLGGGLSIELPEGWEVEPVSELTPPDDECGAPTGNLSHGETVFVNVSRPNTACSTGEPQPAALNGEHGDYLSIDDASAPENESTAEVPTGSATLFEQDYEECTQECTTTREHVGLIELDEPSSEDHPTLMVVVSDEDASGEELLLLLEAVSATE